MVINMFQWALMNPDKRRGTEYWKKELVRRKRAKREKGKTSVKQGRFY